MLSLVTYAGCAVAYALLATLIVGRGRCSSIGWTLATASLVTSAWAASVAVGAYFPTHWVSRAFGLAHSAAWDGFALFLFFRLPPTASLLAAGFSALCAP